MLLIIPVSGEQLISKKDTVKRSIRLDEVADFADVVEPESNLNKLGLKTEQPVFRREVRPSLFKRSDIEDNESKDDTLKVELVGVQGTDVKTPNDLELSIKGSDDTKVGGTPKKRSVSKKYSNLLHLKYYYARGLPVRGHYNPNLVQGKSSKLMSTNKLLDKVSQKDSKLKVGDKSKRSPVNILPILSEQNPYMSGLADATNDAYLKMRNYAATLMLILTTPKPFVAKISDPRGAITNVTQSQPTSVAVEMPKMAGTIKAVPTNNVNGNNNLAPAPSNMQTGNVKVGVTRTKKYSRRNIPNRKKKKVKKAIVDHKEEANSDIANEFSDSFTKDKVKRDISSAFANNILGSSTDFMFKRMPDLNVEPTVNVPVANPSIVNAIPSLNTDQLITTSNADSTNDNNELINIKVKTFPHANIVHAIKAPNHQHLTALKETSTKKNKVNKSQKKITESPFTWENNLLKEANIKVKRVSEPTGPEETVIGKEAKVATEMQKDIPVLTETEHLEISSKMLTPAIEANQTHSCVINKAPEADQEDQCEEQEGEEDESCSGMDEMANNTCGGFMPVSSKTQRAKRLVNTNFI